MSYAIVGVLREHVHLLNARDLIQTHLLEAALQLLVFTGDITDIIYVRTNTNDNNKLDTENDPLLRLMNV